MVRKFKPVGISIPKKQYDLLTGKGISPSAFMQQAIECFEKGTFKYDMRKNNKHNKEDI